MRSLLIHLARVGILVAQHVAGELDHHHLHTQADAEGRDVVGAGVVGSDDLALDASLAESRTDDYAILTLQLLSHVLFCEIF